nr:hypothetical protein Q903MT_gene6532 [Picea sitchensis]
MPPPTLGRWFVFSYIGRLLLDMLLKLAIELDEIHMDLQLTIGSGTRNSAIGTLILARDLDLNLGLFLVVLQRYLLRNLGLTIALQRYLLLKDIKCE